MKDQHTLIKGYRDLSEAEIEQMNEIKALAEEVGLLCDALTHPAGTSGHPDQRWVAIGRTQLQQGFMALVRSVAKPESF